MEGTKKRRRLSANAWREILARFNTSGESVSAFCRAEGLSANSLRRWQDRLESDTTPIPAQAKPQARSGFVDLGLLNNQAGGTVAAPRLEIRLDLGAGVMLHVVRS